MCDGAGCWIDGPVGVLFRTVLYTLPELIAQTFKSSELRSVKLSIGGPWIQFYAARLVRGAYEVVANRNAYQVSREVFDLLRDEITKAGIWCQVTREPGESTEAVATVAVTISESLKANR